jgi:hypothetical protein
MDEVRIQSDLQLAIDEFGELKRLVDAYSEKHEDLIQKVNTEWLLKTSIANSLNSVYTGIERIFEIILKETDNYRPSGASYHKELLARASSPVENVRCELISIELKDLCMHLLGFRHLARKLYIRSVNLKLALENVNRAELALPMLKKDLEHFFNVFRGQNDHNPVCEHCHAEPCECAKENSKSDHPEFR